MKFILQIELPKKEIIISIGQVYCSHRVAKIFNNVERDTAWMDAVKRMIEKRQACCV